MARIKADGPYSDLPRWYLKETIRMRAAAEAFPIGKRVRMKDGSHGEGIITGFWALSAWCRCILWDGEEKKTVAGVKLLEAV